MLTCSFEFELGARVKDRVTGFVGIVVARCQYATGCIHYSLQSDTIKAGEKIPDWEAFDESRLDIIGKGVMFKGREQEHKQETKPPGGPTPKLAQW